MDVHLAIDIATSISIVGAAISYIREQRKERKEKQARFAVDNLKGLLTYLHQSLAKYYDIGNKLRSNPEPKALPKHFLEIIFFLEDVQRELETQFEIYLPIFFPKGKTPDSITSEASKLKTLLIDFKSALKVSDNNKIVTNMDKIEPTLKCIEKTVAEELKRLLSDS